MNFKRMKLLFGSTVCLLSASMMYCAPNKNTSKVPELKGSGIVRMDDFAFEQVKRMKTGWNLGNTFDANSNIDRFQMQNEGVSSLRAWGMPALNEDLFAAVAKAGFKCVRMPVSWSNHIIDNNYTIDPEWISKVKEAVGWAIKNDLVVIINIHHDNFYSEKDFRYGRGYYPLNSCYEESEKFVARTWEQIAEAFKNYKAESIVFETLNEPRLRGDEHEWNYVSSCSRCREAMNCINNLNQKAVDVIRASGMNNVNRLIMVPSYVASPWAAFDGKFRVPTDSSRRICVSTHAYSPYEFAMLKNSQGGTSTFTAGHKKDLKTMFEQLDLHFVSKGVPVIMSEYGATNKNNLNDRKNWFAYYVGEAKKCNVVCVLWDNNSPNNSDESERFGYLKRSNNTWYFPELITSIMDVF